ncbi:ATP-dependent RNA helicase HrpB [Stieleria maiorica]|uniref:ATP-dependent RNA helicase HrpB n=1 Tax=Stieleria maiorica TaxID=2795974 RepID=A0A5B9MPP5_9BACT|nr:ATP-dependent helicase HrpB [Stieleria maiorica]QEG01715.1 ATP-dependent RNA helicase HrpB [Stieleria maiorica]
MPDRLPIEDCLEAVIAAVGAERPVILRAPPGAGKTTGVPPTLVNGDCLPEGQVILLQPRRIAARAAAHRLSRLAGQPIGQAYGYHVRFDRKVSPQTKVVSMTTGILLRQLTRDPLLEDVGCVIVDEFHERSLEVDLALGMLHRVRTTLRPELRLIVMSATLDTQPVERLMPDAVVIESHGRAYDVDIRYDESLTRPSNTRGAIAQSVAARIPDALQSRDGDVLVFLPGVGEIHQVANLVEGLTQKQGVQVRKLYGDLSPADQDAVLASSDQRKVVLATNVAETSITIPGITCVVDSGLARAMQYDTSVGIPSLRLQPISKASADQRAGRAGRTAPGVCFRLWPSAMHRSRPDHTPPEVATADLSSALLMLASWGERDVFEFPWVTSPTEHAVAAAVDLLVQLGAIDRSLAITSLGEEMNRLPLHPRLSRLMLAAKQYDCVASASVAAALLSERDPFERSLGFDAHHEGLQSDLIHRVVRLQRHIDGTPDPGIHPAGAKNIKRVAETLGKSLRDTPDQTVTTDRTGAGDRPPTEEAISRSLLAAFPDRLAKRRAPGSESGVMVGGRGVKLDRSSAVRSAELFVCVSVDGKGEESLVRLASAVDEAWLPKELIESRRERFFHPSLKAVVARDRTYFLDLLISESTAPCNSDDETTELLFQHAKSNLDSILPGKDKPLESIIARWRFLCEHCEASPLPMSIDQALETVLRELCRGRTTFSELARAPWIDHLKGLLSYEQLQWFDQQAPESLVVPSGNRIRLAYPPGKTPTLAVRIQEVYGWAATPRIAGGSVPLQLHLLGPNHRPQQITDDLESFWKTTYVEVRKELKRRYGKHHWPDDPTTAVATRNGLKPRK